MSKTKIEYGDRTWNVLTGCKIKSEGCVNCWARTMAKRLKAMGRPEYQDAVDDAGNWTGKITLVPERLNEPFSWRKPQHVLVEYMGDLFHHNVRYEYIESTFNVMKKTPQHTYQVLTKRSYRMMSFIQDWTSRFDALPNVYMGVSIENDKRAKERWADCSEVSEMGWKTWVSYEPALGPVNWKGWEFLNQLICGGESGPGARPMHPDWARSARDFCHSNEIPYFFKQWGAWITKENFDHINGHLIPPSTGKDWGVDWFPVMVGKKAAGRLLDRKTWSEMPKGNGVRK